MTLLSYLRNKFPECDITVIYEAGFKGFGLYDKLGIKPGPKRTAVSTGKPDKRQPDKRQHDNKKTPGNTPSLKPHKHKKGD